jgi:hypothetical protein
MNKLYSILFCFLILFSGCAKISPLSPNNKQNINNQNGHIEDIKSNQNGIMADIANLRNKLDVMARDLENLQQGLVNSNNKNFGVQIFQGDGGLIFAFSLIVCGLVIYNYRQKAVNYKKAAEIMGNEIRQLKNVEIENNIFMNALNAKVEEDVYKLLKK